MHNKPLLQRQVELDPAVLKPKAKGGEEIGMAKATTKILLIKHAGEGPRAARVSPPQHCTSRHSVPQRLQNNTTTNETLENQTPVEHLVQPKKNVIKKAFTQHLSRAQDNNH